MTHLKKLILLLGLAVPSVALAHPGRGGMRDARPECVEQHKAKMAPFDANRDGQLDQAERERARAAKKQEVMTKFDANRDGKLDDAEKTAKRKARVAMVFTAVDVNRDNQVSRREAEASCTPLSRGFDRVDADRSGFVTRAELEAAKHHFKHKRGERGEKR